MIYPASYDITILQDATWRAALRITQLQQQITSISTSGTSPLFQCSCHGLAAGQNVVFAPGVTSSNYISLAPVVNPRLPCGMELNTVYYVVASGLTDDQFYVSATVSGSPVEASGDSAGTIYVSQPINLVGYTIDADINASDTTTQVATFACTVTDATNGAVAISIAPAVSSGLAVGQYGYDVSITAPSGDRYYVMQGSATVQRTYSRT